ncbi:Inositol-1-monophosphatase [Jannaschia seosinensis]|uniref:Inositol-1-monophosphatase n=1 Tax=Jannaschia seosinensis TaxID=313367 RepID=A0A0M7BCI6_9RHOB|nr:3'(2'),5'-bisphosphate nucleotidase CysQ [Jannaschia seosinensis]CUH38986.1 Inositol-1-monophosphatase [Jannaschia seosinensis]
MPAPEAADLSLLADAARAAGDIARRHFGQGPESWDKGHGQGPVSEADLEIDAMLHADLTAARRDYGWLSEETADHPQRLSRDRVFIVDPIDGTRAFLAGEPTFTHSLAIVEGGQPVAAAIYLPMKDRLFLAARGQGATRDGAPIRPSDMAAFDGATVLGSRANFANVNWRGGCPPVTRRFVPSLAYRLALVAEGRFDAMVMLRPAWEWDIAAGALIVSEAGGSITNRHGGALRFNNSKPMLDGVIAGGGPLAEALLDRLV